MKLASIKMGRDGQLIVVNRTLTRAIVATGIVATMQAALDEWSDVAPRLQTLYDALNQNENLKGAFPFEPQKLAAPLPRAYQWADASAYVNHVELVRKARGAELPANFWTDPLMYQGGSDGFIGAMEDILVADEAWGTDFEAEVAIITDDVPMGVTPDAAGAHIKLLMLVNDVSLRNLIPNELAKGFGFFHSKPATQFSPVAITPDELGDHWQDGKVQLPLVSILNGHEFGRPMCHHDMTFNFPTLIAHAAKTRVLSAGTVIGSGTVSNVDRSVGSSCIVEKRMLEILAGGEAKTPFMRFGDTIRIEMLDTQKHSLFGAIDAKVTAYTLSR